MANRVPANAIAETIANFEEMNMVFETQIQELTRRMESNNSAIAELEPHAVWADTPTVDPVTE